jgi:hypothetical protein
MALFMLENTLKARGWFVQAVMFPGGQLCHHSFFISGWEHVDAM